MRDIETMPEAYHEGFRVGYLGIENTANISLECQEHFDRGFREGNAKFVKEFEQINIDNEELKHLTNI